MRREPASAQLWGWIWRIAAGLWILAIVVVSVRVAARPAKSTVYPLFAEASRRWWEGQDIYGLKGSGFRYSPLVAPALLPLAALPDRIGGVLWRWLNFGVLMWGLLWCGAVGLPLRAREPPCDSAACCDPPSRSRGEALPTGVGSALMGITLLLIFPAGLANLNNGQANPLVIGLLLAATAAVARGRWTVCALCIAGASVLKVYPIAYGLLLLLLYPRQLWWRLTAALLIGAAVPLVLQHPQYTLHQYRLWFATVWQEDRARMVMDDWYRDIRLPLAYWFGIMVGARAYQVVQLASAAVIAAACLWCRWRGWERGALIVMTLTLACCWMTLFGPATENTTFLLVAPVFAWALILAYGRGGSWPMRALVTIGYLLWLSAHVAATQPHGRNYTLGAPNTIGTAMLLVVALWRCGFVGAAPLHDAPAPRPMRSWASRG